MHSRRRGKVGAEERGPFPNVWVRGKGRVRVGLGRASRAVALEDDLGAQALGNGHGEEELRQDLGRQLPQGRRGGEGVRERAHQAARGGGWTRER